MLARLKQRLPLPLLRRIAPLWIACLIAGSLLPGEAKIAIGSSRLSDQHQQEAGIETGEWKHRTFHIIGFGATAFLFLAIARTATGELVSMAGLFGLGVALEFAQVFVYANRLEPEDMRDDGFGIFGMYALWLLVGIVERRRAGTSERAREKLRR
jgi:MFS family permease